MTAPRLLTIPFSHYCEKARWALSHAEVFVVEEGHVPGFHRRVVRRVKRGSASVPVLVADGRVVPESSEIVAWADARARPVGRLYPAAGAMRDEVLALEKRFDDELGPHIRRVLYFHLLPHRRLVFSLMDQWTPAWERAALRVGYPVLFAGMRRFMRVDAARAAASLARVEAVMDDVEARLEDGRTYLVGGAFTAADLTLASLMAPAVMPPEHPIRLPAVDAFPPDAVTLLRRIQARPVAAYVRRMYRDHRVALPRDGHLTDRSSTS